jgi:hypothetical protein
MNDFTKEELETLHSCLDKCKLEDGEDDALLDKIEKMIDSMGGFNDFPHVHQWLVRSPLVYVETVFGKKAELFPLIIRCKTCGKSYFS